MLVLKQLPVGQSLFNCYQITYVLVILQQRNVAANICNASPVVVVNFWMLFRNFIFKIDSYTFNLLRIDSAKYCPRQQKAIFNLLLALLPDLQFIVLQLLL